MTKKPLRARVAALTETDRVLVGLMADRVAAARVDLGDETQVVLALAGWFEGDQIDLFLDLAIEAARLRVAEARVLPEEAADA